MSPSKPQPSSTSWLTVVRSHPELQALTTPKLTRYIPQAPYPKQAAFLWLTHREAFYGGAAGGGKSSALLMAALQYVDVPGYTAIIFRRTFPDLALPGAIMDRSHDWLRGSDAKWDQDNKTWRFPSGATLTFGYMDNDNARYRYQGTELAFCGFDELTQFSEVQYTYLFSRLRRLEGVNIPLRMRSASNPGGIGHEWVKQRFITGGRDQGRIFIPAMLPDNPAVDQVEYLASLERLDPVTRAQLRDGNWDIAAAGNKFKRHWFEIVEAAPAGLLAVRFWDFAATEPKPGKDPDWTVGTLLGRSRNGLYYVLDVTRMQGTPGQVELQVRQTAELDGKHIPVFGEQEPGASGKSMIDHYTRRVLPGWAFRGVLSTGSKEVRANPFSSQAEAGNVKLLRAPWNEAFLSELSLFPQPGVHDDIVDSASGAYAQLAQPVVRRRQVVEPVRL
jgi:predicted phage terminase large subunit-like protein